MEWSWSEYVLIGIVTVCAVTDAARRKIYNAVVFPALLIALAGHLAAGGWEGAWHSLLGMATGLALLLIPYLLGGMGAGDVKLLALVGALKGPAFAADAAIYMALLGFFLSAAVLLFQRKTRRYLLYVVYSLAAWRPGSGLRLRPDGAMSATMPYGLAIAGGVLLALLWRGVVQG